MLFTVLGIVILRDDNPLFNPNVLTVNYFTNDLL